MRDYRVWLSIVGLMIAGRMLYPALAGDRFSPVRENELLEMVHLCSETGESFTLRAKESPAKNPRTGRFTLMPGLYCPKCREWRASPPLEVLQHNPSARLCPKDKTSMIKDGPPPEKK